DYNFEWDKKIYDGDDWSGRASGQPFFMQVQLSGGKLREGAPDRRAAFRQRVIADLGSATDPAAVELPPYYPRDPVLLEDWALYLDAVRYTDKMVGDVLKRLDDEGLTANTLVIFMTDHGISHA
ncbi:MAG: sulfatase-like hydrolase/transferase, partial [Pirellulaceae bacterium]